MRLDRSTLFPLLVPRGYLSGAPRALCWRLLDGLEVALVSYQRTAVDPAQEARGVAQYVRGEDLGGPVLTAEEARAIALENLVSLVERKALSPTVTGDGDHGMLMFVDHWLAATCVLLPGLWGLAREALGTGELVASVPHRDALLVFPMGTAESRAAVTSAITIAERGVRKPITDRLLRVLPRAVEPWWERAPVEWLE